MEAKAFIRLRQVLFQRNYDGYIIFNFKFGRENKSKKFNFFVKNIALSDHFEFSVQGVNEEGSEYEFGSFLASSEPFTDFPEGLSPDDILFFIGSNSGDSYLLEDVTMEEEESNQGETERFVKERRINVSCFILKLVMDIHQILNKVIEEHPELEDRTDVAIESEPEVEFQKDIPESKIKEWFK
ncbi:MAG: hypothetical protein WCW87_03630 [Candidatus Paceibacterota bacterium]